MGLIRNNVSAGSSVPDKQILCSLLVSYVKWGLYICSTLYYCKNYVKCNGYNILASSDYIFYLIVGKIL